MPRTQREWPGYETPRLVAVSGHRDQTLGITYMPWADAIDGLVGWEITGRTIDDLLVYVVPSVDVGVMEIRCHATTAAAPDPANDELIGKFTLPPKFHR